MSIEERTSLHGWHEGAPTKEDFAEGNLMVIYEHFDEKPLYSCHNTTEMGNDYMIEVGYEPIYWKRFAPVMSMPDGLDKIYVMFAWTQKGGAEVCFGN